MLVFQIYNFFKLLYFVVIHYKEEEENSNSNNIEFCTFFNILTTFFLKIKEKERKGKAPANVTNDITFVFLCCHYPLILPILVVVEMFFLNKNDEYLEVELGPWGQHLLLLLKGERNAIKHSLPLDYIVTEKIDPVGEAPVSEGKKGVTTVMKARA